MRGGVVAFRTRASEAMFWMGWGEVGGTEDVCARAEQERRLAGLVGVGVAGGEEVAVTDRAGDELEGVLGRFWFWFWAGPGFLAPWLVWTLRGAWVWVWVGL